MSAVVDGKCVDTSMGLTPLQGLMMGTRCGDIDPAAVLFIKNKRGLTDKEMDNRLNKNLEYWESMENLLIAETWKMV